MILLLAAQFQNMVLLVLVQYFSFDAGKYFNVSNVIRPSIASRIWIQLRQIFIGCGIKIYLLGWFANGLDLIEDYN